MEDPNSAERPVSCNTVKGGLLLHYADGTSKLVPHRHGPIPWPNPAEPRFRNRSNVRISAPAVLMVLPGVAPVLTLEGQAPLSVVLVKRLSGDALIAFSDGRCAVYSAELLSRLFLEAEDMPTDPDMELQGEELTGRNDGKLPI